MWCVLIVACSVGRVVVVGVIGDNNGGGIPFNLFYILPRSEYASIVLQMDVIYFAEKWIHQHSSANGCYVEGQRW